MRASQKPNRARGRGSRKSGGNSANRVYESSGPEGKVRGTPQQIIDKYATLARDSQTAGNRVMAENFLQHAEHYQRLLEEAMGSRQEQRRDSQQSSGADQPDIGPGEDADSGADGAVVDAASKSGGKRKDASNQGNSRGGDRRDGQPGGGDPRDAGVSGLTMIDSGKPDDGNLLVDAEELSASQPRRRPRRREQEQSASASEADAQSD